MSCTVEPTPEERAASAGKYKELLQTAIAYEEMRDYWHIFQQELCEYLTGYNGDLNIIGNNQEDIEKYPTLTAWMRQHAAADIARRQRKLVLDEIASKLSQLDDATLAELGFKRT